MPEPEPYHEPPLPPLPSPQRSSHSSVDSYGPPASSGPNDMLRRVTASTVNNRRLPQAPNGTSTSPDDVKPPVPPLPYEYRSSPQASYDFSADSSAGDSYATSLTRLPTYRPPGALPPTNPSSYSTGSQSPTYGDVLPHNANGYYKSVDTRQFHAPLGPENTPRSAHSSLSYSSLPTPTDLTLQYGSYVDPTKLERNSSISSRLEYMSQLSTSTGQSHKQDIPEDTGNMIALHNSYDVTSPQTHGESASDLNSNHFARRPSDMLRTLAHYGTNDRLEGDEGGSGYIEDDYWEDEEEEDENRFVNFALLSHMAVQLRDKVPRDNHVKGGIPYERAFTGKDIVSTIQSQIQRELAINHNLSTSDRRAALQVARSLQSQLFFYEVEWGNRLLQDGVEDVYNFMDDREGGSDAITEREELPTGVVTMLTRCYSPSCGDHGDPCYAYSCPRKGQPMLGPPPVPVEAPTEVMDWEAMVGKAVVDSLPKSEVTRQNIIHKIISREEQYIQDLDIVESDFIKPLRSAEPPVLPPDKLEDFIDDVFGNILDLRECNRHLLEVLYVRQREQAPIIHGIGDIFLGTAAEFRLAYPTYIGHFPIAEKRMRDEIENNSTFRLFLEQCSRQSSRPGEVLRLDLKHFLNRPSEHLQKYPVTLEAIRTETAVGNPDADYLTEAIEAIKNLQSVALLRTFQSAMGKGAAGKWEWHDLVSPEIRQTFSKQEAKRQAIIFELIKGEQVYVKDLENIDIMYIQPLRSAEPPIIPRERLDQFIIDVFHNFGELHHHHRRLVEKFHEIQREQHPTIRSIIAPIFDAALNFREAYMEYIPNYPIAEYRIGDEMENNLAFRTFVEQCVRHPDARKLDMKNFINRPIPRLLRYELLLKGILEDTPVDHEDVETIPHVIDVIKALGKEAEPGVTSAKQKVELWRYNSNLVFKAGESVDMDLLDQNRSLIHSGKLLRQPDSGLEWNGWSELFVLLFDNYLVMTKPKERDGVLKYHVNRRPIPLDLLTPVNFTDPPTQRGTGLLRNLRGGERHADTPNYAAPGASPEVVNDPRSVYPLTLHHNGRLGGPYILYAESSQARNEWKQKLDEALGLRKVVQESNKVFEVETLSADTFLVPSVMSNSTSPTWNQENASTGKVTCSVPFNTADGRPLVAVGCAEGVWIGYRHDPQSMRRVLHLRMVTQCAMLEEFGIFLVLADKSLFAYHIEALVPTSPNVQTSHSTAPQKLNGNKDVQFFSVGSLHGRTLVVYMKKKGLESIFRVLEPVLDKINEKVKAPVGLGTRLGFRSNKSEWFRIYRDFFLPTESFDLIFLKARVVVLCAKGFEIMDLNDFNSITIPRVDDPRVALAKRCESCRPMGMFRSGEDEFLLCYDEFGIYVDKHGDLSRSAGTIEWEGTAERVALHSPYVLIFDTRFIEVRHVETGRLAQIIPGNDVRCLYDGRGVGNHVTATPMQETGEEQEAQVHAVMNADHGNPKVIAQRVVELIPTVPLYLPGSLSSPGSSMRSSGMHQSGYFPPPLSSPEVMRQSYVWRP